MIERWNGWEPEEQQMMHGEKDFCVFGWKGRPFVGVRSHLNRDLFDRKQLPCLQSWTKRGYR